VVDALDGVWSLNVGLVQSNSNFMQINSMIYDAGDNRADSTVKWQSN